MILDLCFNVFNGIRGVQIKWECFACDGVNEYVHVDSSEPVGRDGSRV